MKKYLLSVLILGTVSLFAQDKLIVEYESRMEFDIEAFEKKIQVGGVNKEEVVQALKESLLRSNYYSLVLTPDESEFQYIERITNDQPSEGRVRIEMSAGGRGVTYKNLKENLSLRTEDTFNQKFLIKDSLKEYEWKISRESKEILGYEVRKAETTIDSTTNIVAWYAPKLPYRNGPAAYHGLPGLILEIEVMDNSDEEKRKHIYKAITINVDTKKEQIKRPAKGKEVNSKEFEAFVKEQANKMKEIFSGGVDKD